MQHSAAFFPNGGSTTVNIRRGVKKNNLAKLAQESVSQAFLRLDKNLTIRNPLVTTLVTNLSKL